MQRSKRRRRPCGPHRWRLLSRRPPRHRCTGNTSGTPASIGSKESDEVGLSDTYERLNHQNNECGCGEF